MKNIQKLSYLTHDWQHAKNVSRSLRMERLEVYDVHKNFVCSLEGADISALIAHFDNKAKVYEEQIEQLIKEEKQNVN